MPCGKALPAQLADYTFCPSQIVHGHEVTGNLNTICAVGNLCPRINCKEEQICEYALDVHNKLE